MTSKPPKPRPTEGKPVTAIESVLFILRQIGMQELYLNEIEKRHVLFPKLLAALEEEHLGDYFNNTVHYMREPNCEVCALLQESRQEMK